MARIKKIESLTTAQWQEMREYRETQRREALRTDAIDHDGAREAVRNLYKSAGLAPPAVFILQSPFQCLLARGLLALNSVLRDQLKDQLWTQLGDQLRDQLWDQLGDQLVDQLWDQLRGQLGGQLVDQLGDQLGGQLRGQLGDQLGGQLVDQLRDQLRDQLWDQLRGQLWDQLRGQLGGQLVDQLWDQLGDHDLYQNTLFLGAWDNYWLAFYDFPRRIGVRYKPETEAQLDAYRLYADRCGVAYFYRGVAFVSDRPERISFDHQRRLHADDGPALLWRDGFAIYAWHGLRVPAALIERRFEMTPKQIMTISNAEQRRAAIEIYGHVHGPERFVTDLGARLIAEDTAHGFPRRLYQVENERFLHVINGSLEPDGTRREFLLGAHPEANSPHSAVALSYGRPAGKYREAVRT